MAITFSAERALRWLVDQPNQQASIVPENVVAPDELSLVYDELVSASLIQETRSIDGSFSFLLTPRGRIEASRMRHAYRASLAQRRILEWLAHHPDSSPSDLLETDYAEDFSGRLTSEELHQAVQELEDGAFIKGLKAWGSEMLRAQLTSEGHRLHRSQMSIDQVHQSGGMTTMNISADNYGNQTIGNQAVGGQVHTMNAEVSMGLSVDDITQALEEFRATVQTADISDEDKEELTEEASNIEKKLPKRGVNWALQGIQALATAALPVLGEEGASILLGLFSHSR